MCFGNTAFLYDVVFNVSCHLFLLFKMLFFIGIHTIKTHIKLKVGWGRGGVVVVVFLND